MESLHSTKLILGAFLTFASLLFGGNGTKCDKNNPTVKQTEVIGLKNPPKFIVEVRNNCPMCPVTDIHVKCGNFSQGLVNPRLFEVISYDNCVVNGGLPLGPLQKLSFNYSHQHYDLYPTSWFFQCE